MRPDRRDRQPRTEHNRFRARTFRRVALLLACCSLQVESQEIAAPNRFKLILPEIVDRGEFRGTVMERTEEGLRPAMAGTWISIAGEEILVEAEGRITVPGLSEEFGNVFLTGELLDSGRGPSGGALLTDARHVEVVPADRELACRIATVTSELVPGGEVSVEGQGLAALTGAALVAGDGRRMEIRELASSPMQRIWRVPTDLPAGSFQLVAWEADGKEHRTSTRSLSRSEPAGEAVLGPEPRAPVPVANALPERFRVRYDEGANETTLDARFRLVDAEGERLSNEPVDVALSHPGGLEVIRAESNRKGTVRVRRTLPGNVDFREISPHIFRVPGFRWKEPPPVTELWGYKYWDLDGDGLWEGGDELRPTEGEEPPVSGWAITLDGPDGTRTTTTGEDGRFAFQVSAPGLYTLSEESRPGWRAVTPESYQVAFDPQAGEVYPPFLFGNETIKDDCVPELTWARKTPIKVTRGLDFHPKGEPLKRMLPGSRIALSILAEDTDVLGQTCTGCGATAPVKRIGEVKDQVRYKWKLSGAGKLLSTEGSTVFFRLPDKVKAKTTVEGVVELTLDNPDGKAADSPLTATVSIKVTGGKDCYLSVQASIDAPSKLGYDNDIKEVAGSDCDVSDPTWDEDTKITTSLSVPARICPGATVLLGAEAADQDKLRVRCTSDSCNAKTDEIEVDDPLSLIWSDGGAGGLFPLGNKGPRVLYQAPASTGNITFEVAIQESGQQAVDDPKKERKEKAKGTSRRLFDVTSIDNDLKGSKGHLEKNITVGKAHGFVPAWKLGEDAAAEQFTVKRVDWSLDLGGKSGKIDKSICSASGITPKAGTLRFKGKKDGAGLQVSWATYTHIHGEKQLRFAAAAEIDGTGLHCSDAAWNTSNFMTGEAKNRFRLFFDPLGKRDNGRVESDAKVNDEDMWGMKTDLGKSKSVKNWFLHWSQSTYAAAEFDHRQKTPPVVYEAKIGGGNGKRFGDYSSKRGTIRLADAATGESSRDAFSGSGLHLTSDMRYFNQTKVTQRTYELKGHALASKTFIHEMGHYRSLTANWASGGIWRTAYGARSQKNTAIAGGVTSVPNTNSIRPQLVLREKRVAVTTKKMTAQQRAKLHLQHAVPKYDITIELDVQFQPAPNKPLQTRTISLTLQNAWVVSGGSIDKTTAKLVLNKNKFVIENLTERWVFQGLTLTRFKRANDPDADYVPNQVEDQMGLNWNAKSTHSSYKRASAQVPDQEFFADHGVIGLTPAVLTLPKGDWENKVEPGGEKKDWANPGKQSDPKQ